MPETAMERVARVLDLLRWARRYVDRRPTNKAEAQEEEAWLAEIDAILKEEDSHG